MMVFGWPGKLRTVFVQSSHREMGSTRMRMINERIIDQITYGSMAMGERIFGYGETPEKRYGPLQRS